jgi:hypothetical protein
MPAQAASDSEAKSAISFFMGTLLFLGPTRLEHRAGSNIPRRALQRLTE